MFDLFIFTEDFFKGSTPEESKESKENAINAAAKINAATSGKSLEEIRRKLAFVVTSCYAINIIFP